MVNVPSTSTGFLVSSAKKWNRPPKPRVLGCPGWFMTVSVHMAVTDFGTGVSDFPVSQGKLARRSNSTAADAAEQQAATRTKGLRLHD